MDKKTYIYLLIYNVLGLLICLGTNIYLLTFIETFPLLHLSALLVLVAMASALMYIFSSYRKQGALHLRRFLHFYAGAEIVNAIYVLYLGDPVRSLLVCSIKLVIFGLLLVLSLSQNLGKKKSLLIARTIAAINLVTLIVVLLLNSQSALNTDVYGMIFALCSASNLTLSLTVLLCIHAKYMDKEERGRK